MHIKLLVRSEKPPGVPRRAFCLARAEIEGGRPQLHLYRYARMFPLAGLRYTANAMKTRKLIK